MPGYNPKAIEPRWQQLLGGAQDLPHAGRSSDKPKFYILDMFPYPSGGRPARRPSGGLHRHRHPGPLPPHARLQRPAPDGLGRLRPARRAVRHRDRHASARHHAEEHRHLPPADQDARLQLRLGPRGRHHRSRITSSGRSGSSCSSSTPGTTRSRSSGRPIARVADPGRGAGAGRGGGARLPATASGWRTRPRCRSTGAPRWARCWPTRKSSTASRSAAAIPSCACRCGSGCCASPPTPSGCWTTWSRSTGPSRSRRCSATGSAGARARRSISRCQPEAPARATASASSPRGPTRCSAPPTWCWPPSIRWSTRITTPEQRAAVEAVPGRGRAQERPGAHRAGQEEDRRLHRRLRHQPGQQRDDPDLDRRLRADQLRHRRDHGRAGPRRARLRVRQAVQPADPHRGPAAGRVAEEDRQHAGSPDRGLTSRTASRSTPARSTACRRRSSRRRSPPGWRSAAWVRRKVNYKLRDWLFSRQRYWGEPFPILHEIDANGNPTGVIEPLSPEELPLRLPELEDLQAVRQAGAAAGQGDRLGRRHAQRQALPARDEHHAAVGRLVLVLPALHRPEERQGVLRSGQGEVLDAGRSVRRRRRARGAAPALLRASGTRCCTTAATSTRRSRFSGWSTRA